MNKKVKLMICAVLVLIVALACFVACGEKEEQKIEVTVTVVRNGQTTKTIKVERGKDAETALKSGDVLPPDGMWSSWYYYDAEYTQIVKANDVIDKDVTLYCYRVALPDGGFKVSYVVDGKTNDFYLLSGKVDKNTYYNRATMKVLENPNDVKFYSDAEMTQEFDFTDCNVTYTTDENGARHYGSVTIYVKLA